MGIKARVVDGWCLTSDGRVSHFREREFYVGSNWLSRASLPGVDEELVQFLHDLRYAVNFGRSSSVLGVRITSGVRSKQANQKAGGDPKSLHLTAGAADVKVSGIVGWQMVPYLETITISGKVGRWGVYHVLSGGHSHIDVDRTRSRRRFVCMPGGKYSDLETWCSAVFGKSFPEVTDEEANRALGF